MIAVDIDRDRKSIRVLKVPGAYGTPFYNCDYSMKCWVNIDGRDYITKS